MNLYKKIGLFKSLKTRLIVLLIITCTIPIILIGAISFTTTLATNRRNINIAIESELSQIVVKFENIMNSMRYVSQQLVLEGFVNQNIFTDLNEISDYSSIQVIEETQQKIAFYEVSNPNIANITYYFQNKDGKLIKLNSSLIKERISFNNTRLSNNNMITYYGPHKTNSIVSDYLALSMVRKIEMDDTPDIFIYIESAYRALDEVFQVELSKMGTIFLMTSNTGGVVFSSDSNVISQGDFIENGKENVIIDNRSYYSVTKNSEFNWNLTALIPISQYNKDITSFMLKYISVFIAAICTSVFIAILIWKMVYIPFIRFSKNLKSITNNNIIQQVERMNVKELDENIEVFNYMKEQILILAKNIENEHKDKAALEIKQLFYKINPHFLYNTLDTLKWYAKTRNEDEMVKFVSALNQLLIYNMEKNKHTTLQSEINAIENYIFIQNMKYDIEFIENINVSSNTLFVTIPRFILQPLVENAILHGLEGNGKIILDVSSVDNYNIAITVSDNGYGISVEKVSNIIELSQNPYVVGEGIGLQYVFKMLNNEFGSGYKFDIKSTIGKGTDIIITIPIDN